MSMSVQSTSASQRPSRALVGRFRKNDHGATAVEFALVAPLLFIMLFAIVGISLVFFAGVMLENATNDASRQLMTGEIETLTSETVCSKLLAPEMFNCRSLRVTVSNAQCFSNLAPPSSGTPGPGGPAAAVMVQVSYPWPAFGFQIGNGVNVYMLNSVSVFRNASANSTPVPSC